MSTSTSYRDGSIDRFMTNIYYNDSGTWREMIEMYYNDNGTWRLVFQNAPVVSLDSATTVDGADTSSGSATATCVYNLTSDGLAQVTTASGLQRVSDNWWTAAPSTGIGSSYEARLTIDSTNGNGTFGGSGVSTWLALTGGLQWTLSDTGNNVERQATRQCTVEIRDTATSTVQATATINFNTLLFGP